mmetsp:Transcript_28523/g.93204  ORF Transcript_28523/g.93204 Transcript_28523/m.93204 type:complete len:337 (-) Transcript_28523:65-1075(-)|eukprot:CAMPEP_0170157580 /NCGR_PEP_ID=MMETSP0033_2-20121228/66184_1 /TAXON_ID=195969 /ORGANISM="Dolichomastix tenuilepis, Strain CCMP3274" /LENGTH=336 /DNA_ID=CAMNT_0010394981 /DNA_START=161 /DNA_END=1171 /DNA_ORIENTATION=+
MSSSSQSKMPAYSRFTQQDMFACRPLLTPKCAIILFSLIGVVFIPIGAACVLATSEVVEVTGRYDDSCNLGGSTDAEREEALMELDGAGSECEVVFNIDKKMSEPVFLYYELTNFYQNHRRYVRSRSDAQLRGDVEPSIDLLEDCKPKLYTPDADEAIINPCGLVAWSYFNDSYAVTADGEALVVNENDIAWDSDVEYKFANYVPENFNDDPDLRGGGTIAGNVQLDEHFIVWMRTATLSTFRKLWGRIEVDLEEGTEVRVKVHNRYNTYRFGGTKSVVLSTTSFLGGKNFFLGATYLAVGCVSLALAAAFFAASVVKPRALGDVDLLSWNKAKAH